MSSNRIKVVLCSLAACVATQVIVAGCDITPNGGSPAGAGLPAVLSAKALSNRYVELTFAGAVGADWQDPGRFLITHPEGSALPVENVRTAGGDRSKLLLRTGPQQPVEYRLRVVDGASTADLHGLTDRTFTFMGSTEVMPSVHTAVALDRTHVLVLFSDPKSPVYFNSTNHYTITDLGVADVHGPGSTPIAGLPPVPDLGVVLTTARQSGKAYTVEVRDDGHDMLIPYSATFLGVAGTDTTSPTIRSTTSASPTSVLVAFTKPLNEVKIIGCGTPACMVDRFEIQGSDSAGASSQLGVLGGTLQFMNTHVVLDTQSQAFGVEYRLKVLLPTYVEDLAGNQYQDPKDAGALTFIRAAASPVSVGDLEPRVAGAMSTGNTSVVVAFNKSMADAAADVSNYVIVTGNVNAEAGGLGAVDARFMTTDGTTNGPLDRSRVELTTLSQSTVEYRLSMIGVHDIDGKALAPQRLGSDGVGLVLLGGNEASFAGTGPSGAMIDTDGDGLPDAEEQLGWNVTVYLSDGTVTTREVTSEPTLPDTDEDGLSDATEKMLRTDPRDNDTDDDSVLDEPEVKEFLSSPIKQDTDGDGLSDPKELRVFRTSPILADTDGDQISDFAEIVEVNRNPLIADLPLPQVIVGEYSLDLKKDWSYTDEEGQAQTHETSMSQSFTQSRTDTLGTSDTRSTESELTFGQEIGVEGGSAGWKISGSATFGQSYGQGFSSTTNRESSRESQQQWENSMTSTRELSQSHSLTLNTTEASVQAVVDISNNSDIAFSIRNIELSMLQQDRVTGLRLRPIATLGRPEADDFSLTSEFHIGPFEQSHGPLIFKSQTVFPNRVEELLREPTGLIFKVANVDVLDENGRNLAFTIQECQDKTVALTIDYGDGQVESYRVATASRFDSDGRAEGITMERALEIIGMTKSMSPSDDPGVTYATQLVDRTVGSQTISVEALVRIRDVSNSSDHKKFWAAVTSNTALDPNHDFSTIPLHAHDTVLLMYTSDEDGDGLFLREEYIYGTDDTKEDSDGDGLGDFEEVRDGWTVFKLPGLPYKAFPSPARPDSDLDRLRDDEEMPSFIGAGPNGTCDTTDTTGDDVLAAYGSSICVKAGANRIIDTVPAGDDDKILRGLGTDPNRSDTDDDGRSDFSEIHGDTKPILQFDGDDDDLNDPELYVLPYSDWAITAGENGLCDTRAYDGDDFSLLGTQSDKASKLCFAAGLNGVIDTDPVQGDDLIVAAPKIAPGPDGICQTTAPLDDDVIESRTIEGMGKVCISAGLNNEIDTTALGDDFLRVAHKGMFATDPLKQDTDSDGINDGREYLIGLNPNSKDAGRATDTDGDGLFDDEEDAGWVLADGSRRVTSDVNRPDTDRDGIPDIIERAIGSDPRNSDTDGDTLPDHKEFDPDNLDVDGAPMFVQVALDDAIQRCNDAPYCGFSAASDSWGTHPGKADTDGDGRRDDAEINPTCAVWPAITPTGTVDAQTVETDPRLRDEDNDGLGDYDECNTFHTHPNDSDSDDDGTGDGVETTTTVGDLSRDPLRADRIVTFDYGDLHVYGDCDTELYTGAELHNSDLSEVQLQLPNLQYVYGDISCSPDLPGCPSCCYEDYDTDIIPPGGQNCYNLGDYAITFEGQSFVLLPDQTFTASNVGTWHECDGGAARDETLPDWSYKYTWTVVQAVSGESVRESTTELTEGVEGGRKCKFGIKMSIAVD